MITVKSLIFKGLPALTLGIVALAPDSSNAAVIWNQSTNILPMDGEAFWYDRVVSSSRTSLFAFDEAQNVSISGSDGIKINKQNPLYVPNDSFANYDPNIAYSDRNTMLQYDWDNLNDLPILPTGTYSSHFIHLFLPFNSNGRRDGRATIEATVVFDAPIVGLMGDPSLVNASQFAFFPGASNYPWKTTLEGLQWNGVGKRDYAKVTGPNNNILQIRMTSDGQEFVRVITAAPVSDPTVAAPEPLTILGSATAIGFATLFKRKMSK
ncbi:hypothetical protein PCC7424_1806 [Gloeothece citriformis PCC 7424]|uniref:PEP-CTERM protein-sorting domain-containing protein n=1 Tax=Gloeothece citriformis (strain PCC 7424) TaxID=65393 RepID=B7KCD3_GLOC7|nr:PEP-CTERM sorting domain-containing protein [Gloeothece citriformis]ACK70238.1 hypothetical protein PCC7424_1806 [Gloeothece citriformis PCC 7424]